MPKKKEAYKKIQDASREKILMAAFELFSGKGYSTTSVESIAKKAKVSKGLIYHYFKSKQDILKGIFHLIMKEADEFMKWSDQLPPKEFCKKWIDYSFDYIINKTKFNRLLIGLTIQPNVVKNLSKEIETAKEVWMQQLVQLFHMLGYDHPEAEAYLLGSTFDGIAIGYLALGKEYPIEKVRQLVLKRYNL